MLTFYNVLIYDTCRVYQIKMLTILELSFILRNTEMSISLFSIAILVVSEEEVFSPFVPDCQAFITKSQWCRNWGAGGTRALPKVLICQEFGHRSFDTFVSYGVISESDFFFKNL